MIDIWTILGITLAASLTGLLLLVVKGLFRDKLNARWHYLIWAVFLVRLLVPVGQRLFQTPLALTSAIPLPLFLNYCRYQVSKLAGAALWEDRLFQVYKMGAAALLLYYALAYVWLWLRIRKGEPGGEEIRRQVQKIADKYQVRGCRRIRICSWTFGPFVCGLFRPVLVLPDRWRGKEENLPVESVILHELLHMQYGDVVVNLLLHVIRILNWFNPFLWYILGEIQNDNEALCDQRVLERLNASCHKEYGQTLLDMADQADPPLIGTTHMTGGGRNIRLRLQRMVDLTHVPRKNTLISLCITLILTMACVGYAPREARFETGALATRGQWERMLLRASFYEVSTPQEALYIYMRAFSERNLAYMALVIPEAEREAYEDWALEQHKLGRCLGAGLCDQGEENKYFYQAGEAALEILEFTEEEEEYRVRVGVFPSVRTEEEGDFQLFLRIRKEYGWKIWVTGRAAFEQKEHSYYGSYLEPENQKSLEGELFQAEVSRCRHPSFNTLPFGGIFYLGDQPEGFETCFSQEDWRLRIRLSYLGEEDLRGKQLGIAYGPVEQFPENMRQRISTNGPDSAYSSSDGTGGAVWTLPADWDKTKELTCSIGEQSDWEKIKTWWLGIYVDGQLREEFLWEDN